jgi:hypothetical protein
MDIIFIIIANAAVEQCPGGASVSNSWFPAERSGGGNQEFETDIDNIQNGILSN